MASVGTPDDHRDDRSSVLALIHDLAHSRSDHISAQKRGDLVRRAEELLEKNPDSRQALAEVGEIRCTSIAAFKRIARIYCVAIRHAKYEVNIRKNLCDALCSLMRESKDANLLEDCKRSLSHGKGRDESVENVDSIFKDIARNKENPARIVGLAFTSEIDWSLFVEIALTNDPLATVDDMSLCKYILQDMKKSDWEDLVGPAALLKLKAKPESVLSTMEGLTRYLDSSVVALSNIVINEYLSVLIKNLKSPRELVREKSSMILQHLAKATIQISVSSNDEEASRSKVCLSNLVQGVADTKTLTQPHQRQIVYETLYEIGANIAGTTKSAASKNKRKKKSFLEPTNVTLDAQVISDSLSGICHALAKEAKSATESREEGVRALLLWTVVGRRNREVGGSGYEQALSFLRKPVIAKNGGEAVALLGTMIQQVSPDTVENLVLDLWKDEKFGKGLEAFVEDGNKKQASSSAIPPVDGLLAIYLNLLQAVVTSSKLSVVVEKALSTGSSPVEKTSFVYGKAITQSVRTTALVGQILPLTIAMYTKITNGSDKAKWKSSSAKIRALACCITHPVASGRQAASESLERSIRTVLDYEPIAEPLSTALLVQVNELSLEDESLSKSLNANRQLREENKTVGIKGKCGPTGCHRGVCVGSVRRIARILSTRKLSEAVLAQILALLHAGTSLRSSGQQRSALVKQTSNALAALGDSMSTDMAEAGAALADPLSELASAARSEKDSLEISESIHLASRSLLVSLGIIASDYSQSTDDSKDQSLGAFAAKIDLLTTGIAARLSNKVVDLIDDIKSFSLKDIGIYRTHEGLIFREVKSSAAPDKDAGKGRRTEDEEWELQIKKELAKKKAAASSAGALSANDQQLVQEQNERRSQVASVIDVRFHRVLDSIQSLVTSDIEIGNECLPFLSRDVLRLAVLKCPAISHIPGMKEKVMTTLTAMSSCVYEIQEEHAPMVAAALVISCRGNIPDEVDLSKERTNNFLGQLISPLPSPCEPAATTVFEMDEYQEELSGASFYFLFPVIRAALTGPRTTPGCEGALRVLQRHTILLAGQHSDSNVIKLRSDMINTVMELLRHDRSKAFSDPDPYETLVCCYKIDDSKAGTSSTLSTGELAPLLDERGALGPKNCRLASMIALRSIATSHKMSVQNNPLIESRIWLNCFDENDSVKAEARSAWAILCGQEFEGDDVPAPPAMYAIPLLSLLSNDDEVIARAAAKAYAYGLKAHPDTVNRNIEKLCSVYIDSFPAPGDIADKTMTFPSSEKAQVKQAPTSKKPVISTGLKKKPTKRSALQVAGIGQPKKSTKKKTAVAAALLKPKQERVLDQAALEGQFKTGPQKTPPEKDSPEKAAIRLGIIKALAEVPNVKFEMETDTLKWLANFLMAFGIADENENVNNASRNTLRDIIAVYGSSDAIITHLLPHLDEILKNGAFKKDLLGVVSQEKIPKGVAASDRRKEGAVVALGSVAIHLKGPENASKIDTSVDMLISSLETPNADVQASVADALSKLMKKGNTQERIERLFEQLMQSCLEGSSSSTRRGGAYGIAAAVKGSGIASLKKYSIVTQLEEACATGTSTNKEGSLFAIQLLCIRLGLLFEPYVIVLLPSLLKCFGDGSDHVRKAASEAVGVIMSKLSAHGVKLVMPAVLTSFNDSSWRTKQASINMLGSMSHLAPKQLASALPKVVPKLIEAFADTHPKVKSSAQGALDEISSVIRNPEIHDISAVLLKALTDPADNTLPALEALIETEFLHAIDAPSLALIVPILHRGLRDRAAATKRYGALITGNICTMINDPRDFVPYLPTLMPDLKSSLLDPIPDVRSIAAKSLGSLTRGLGEDSLPDLRPWLIGQLQNDGLSSAERSGAGQGLTEILIASGTIAVESIMLSDILPLAKNPSPSTREGVLWVLCFLPPSLGQGFTSLLDDSLRPLINGLSDENEQVREVAMRAGRVLIKSHGKVHFDKILPVLQAGMTDSDFRIRLSSLMLLGDLLSMIGGTTVLRTDGDTQDDIRRAERAQAQLTLVLGIPTRNRVLSDIYLGRSDNAVAVRQAAVQVWKTVVSVTGRTLRQILPVLVGRIVTDLASGDAERTEMAGKCLGDVVGKLGDFVLPEIIPVLRNSLYDDDSNTRRGVCVGLSEVIGSSTKDQILRFLDIIVKVVQDALCDDDASVREMGASSFQNLYQLVGNRAMDEVVPALMVSLESADDVIRQERALNGLTGILSIRSKELLPYIVPRLIQQPITITHAEALSSIAAVTSTTLYSHFRTIVPALLSYIAKTDNDESIDAVRECAGSVFGNAGEAGVNMLISEIAGNFSSDKAEFRRESCWMMQTFVESRKEQKDFFEQIPVIIRELVQRFNDDDMNVVKAANKAFAALSKHVPAEELAKHIEYLRNLINSMVSDARRRKGGVGDGEFFLPGFNIPKGLEPLLPIYQRGILYGTPTIREASAAGLGEAIGLTSNKFLAGPLIIKMTGPLLRIVGDRNPANVKISILKTLGLILVKGGPALRAFVPQFQTTFVKALSDPSRQVRVEAIGALGLLMPLSTRVDPLIKELVSGSLGKGNAETTSPVVVVQTATLEALAAVLEKGGKKAKSPDSIIAAIDASTTLICHSDDSVREGAAKVMGAACDIVGASKTEDVVQQVILGGDGDDSGENRHGKACSIRRIFSASVGKDLDESVALEMTNLATSYMRDEKSLVQESGIVALGAAVGRSSNSVAALRSVEPDLLSLMGDSKQRLENHQAVARCLCLALQFTDETSKVEFFGTTLLNACLKMAMSGSQRVQFAFNDVLWLALDVSKGQAGLDEYCSVAMFEDARQMKSLHSKVLQKMKKITILDD